MTIYVDKITMDFNTEHYPPHCDRQCVRCKKLKNLVHFAKDIIIVKRGKYLMQYRTTVTCCECLDGMKAYNDKRKTRGKSISIM